MEESRRSQIGICGVSWIVDVPDLGQDRLGPGPQSDALRNEPGQVGERPSVISHFSATRVRRAVDVLISGWSSLSARYRCHHRARVVGRERIRVAQDLNAGHERDLAQGGVFGRECVGDLRGGRAARHEQLKGD